MIKYKLDVQEELKKRGYTSYVIRKNKYLSEGTLAKIKRGETSEYEEFKCYLLHVEKKHTRRNRDRNNRRGKNKILCLKMLIYA